MFFGLFNFDPKPFNTGYLPQKDGHKVFFQEFGNPHGEPIISFHGGPGARSKAKHATSFNLKKYRVILFDQRGNGFSEAPDIVRNNTTADLLSDAKRLLTHLNINKKVIIVGGSWGSTLALLFAEKFPNLVKTIIVNSVFLARKHDEEWINKNSRMFYPDLMLKLTNNVPKGQSLINYYKKLIFSKNKKDVQQAMTTYGQYEYQLGSLSPKFEKIEINDYSLKTFQITLHYMSNNYFIRDNQIIADAKKIKHIPCLIVHNRLDMTCPVEQAWDLHLALPKSKLFIAPYRNHFSPPLYKFFKKRVEEFLK